MLHGSKPFVMTAPGDLTPSSGHTGQLTVHMWHIFNTSTYTEIKIKNTRKGKGPSTSYHAFPTMDFVVVGCGQGEITIWNHKPKITFPKNFCQIAVIPMKYIYIIYTHIIYLYINIFTYNEVYTQKNWKAGLQDSVIHIPSSQITYNLTDKWTNCVWYIQQQTNTHP